MHLTAWVVKVRQSIPGTGFCNSFGTTHQMVHLSILDLAKLMKNHRKKKERKGQTMNTSIWF
jgi:hypothetical protein